MGRLIRDAFLRLHFLRTAFCIKCTYGHRCLVPFFTIRMAFRNFDARNPFARTWALGDVEERVNKGDR